MVALSCGACGAGLREGARFCDACGSAVTTAGSHAEYKQVTVLFADVVHSMDIAAAVGAERLREIMGEVFRRSSAIVQRYGGTVDKFTGDGIMAVFGAPIALEDHAVRACRAALDIQTDVQTLAADVDDRDDVALQLRIGLNSGEVITGEIGSGPMTYTAVGEQVGMAQRMESVAPPGGVMVSDSTARLVEHAALLGEPEQVHIKGARDPVPARRLIGMATGRRSDRAEPTFVGRHWEMGALNGVLERSINGSGSVVGLVGPPGIGKSRIVRELTARAKDAGVEVFTTYCESHTTDVPFHAAAGLLRSSPVWWVWRRRQRGEECATAFRMPTMRICFCSTTCWASPIPRRASPDRPRRPPAPACRHWSTPPRLHAPRRRSTSSRTRTGSTASASRCWPNS